MRSTTRPWRPSLSLLSTVRRAMRGTIALARYQPCRREACEGASAGGPDRGACLARCRGWVPASGCPVGLGHVHLSCTTFRNPSACKPTYPQNRSRAPSCDTDAHLLRLRHGGYESSLLCCTKSPLSPEVVIAPRGAAARPLSSMLGRSAGRLGENPGKFRSIASLPYPGRGSLLRHGDRWAEK